MKRPSFQFYPADWRNNAKLRRCSWAARGAWLEVMGLMHDSDEYGVLRWSSKEIANAIGCPQSLITELVSKSVMKGCDSGEFAGYSFRPRHGRKEGDAVLLVEPCSGPIWLSTRLVRDEHNRQVRGEKTRIDSAPKGGIGEGFDAGPNPTQGDGSTSSSTSTPSVSNTEPNGSGVPAVPHQEIIALYHEVLPELPAVRDWTEKRKRMLQARWRAQPKRQKVSWWRRYFEHVKKSDFLCGRLPPSPGRTTPFCADLEWLITESHFVSVIEGKYHEPEPATTGGAA